MAKLTTKTLPAAGQLGDLVRHIYHPGYCYDTGMVTTAVGQVAATGVRLLGQPVVGNNGAYTLVLGGNIANATGIIADDGLHDLPAAGGVIGPLTILRRGPGQYGAESLPATDTLGTPITPAAFIAVLADATKFNPPLIPLVPLNPTKTQTN